MLCQNDDDDGEVDADDDDDDDDDRNDDDGDDDAGGGIDKWIWLGRTRCTDDRNAFQLKWIATQMCQEEDEDSNLLMIVTILTILMVSKILGMNVLRSHRGVNIGVVNGGGW